MPLLSVGQAAGKNTVMMAFGPFLFMLSTTTYETLKRQTQYRWAKNERIHARANHQYIGIGDDTISLDGTLMPEITGGRLGIDALRLLADQGKNWTLIDGEGHIYGLWHIDSIDETRSKMFADGAARKIQFGLKLTRADDSALDKIGTLTRTLAGEVWS